MPLGGVGLLSKCLHTSLMQWWEDHQNAFSWKKQGAEGATRCTDKEDGAEYVFIFAWIRIKYLQNGAQETGKGVVQGERWWPEKGARGDLPLYSRLYFKILSHSYLFIIWKCKSKALSTTALSYFFLDFRTTLFIDYYIELNFFLFFFVFLLFLWATPVAYGGSQARGRIRAVATGLCQSHSNSGSEPRLQPTPRLTATPDR